MRVNEDKTITLTITLTPKEINDITENSMERVMNNAIDVGGYVERESKSDGYAERGSTLWQDCEDLKWTVNKLWNQTRDAIFRAAQKEGK